MEDAILSPTKDGLAQIVIANPTGFTQMVEEGTELGTGMLATIVEPTESSSDSKTPSTVSQVATLKSSTQRQDLLIQLMGKPDLPESERKRLVKLLSDHHEVFALEDGERGETDLVEMQIDTGDARPIKQPVRRMPFAVRREVAKHLRKMQENGVIGAFRQSIVRPSGNGTEERWVP